MILTIDVWCVCVHVTYFLQFSRKKDPPPSVFSDLTVARGLIDHKNIIAQETHIPETCSKCLYVQEAREGIAYSSSSFSPRKCTV